MSACKPVFSGYHPITFQVFAAVAGGQLTMPGTAGNAGLLGPAGVGCTNCAGVATTDALPAGTSNTGATPEGFAILTVGQADENVAVASFGVFPLTAAGTIAFQDRVKCAANGQVVKWVPGTDAPELRVGKCVSPGGAVATGKVLIELGLV